MWSASSRLAQYASSVWPRRNVVMKNYRTTKKDPLNPAWPKESKKSMNTSNVITSKKLLLKAAQQFSECATGQLPFTAEAPAWPTEDAELRLRAMRLDRARDEKADGKS